MKTIALTLTQSTEEDLHSFFEFQLDEEAIHLAAFTPKNPADKTAYLEKYAKLLADPTVNMQTIWVEGEIAGSISKFLMHGGAGITYWIDKKFWGQGVASTALSQFLQMEPARPIYGHVAFDNYGSQKVLEKCGFVKTGTDKGFANGRQAVIEEFIYVLRG